VSKAIRRRRFQRRIPPFGRAVRREQKGPLVVFQGFQFVDALLPELRRVAVFLI